jgi:hypothetical protein
MPKDVTNGQVIWFEEDVGSLIGRAEVANISGGIASSFSCQGSCPCPPNYSTSYMTPSSANEVPGETCPFTANELRQDCNAIMYGPYNRTADSTWWSDNTNVATVSGGSAYCVNVGSANIVAQFLSTTYGGSGNPCQPNTFNSNPSGPISVQLPQLTGAMSPLVSGDSNSTISGQPFALQVKAVVPNSGGRVPSNFNDSVNVTFPSPGLITGESISQNPVQMSQGVGTTNIIIKIVDTSPFISPLRTILFNDSRGDSYATPGTFGLKVWFNPIATREGLVGSTTACGHLITSNDHFASLPSTGVCNASIMLINGSNQATTTVLDVGPWYPHGSPTQGNPCVGPSDAYWHTTGVPVAEGDSCSNHAGIDLADGTFSDLGSPALSRILWRFP